MAMEMALMVKENNRMRIFQMMPADQAQLDQLTGHDIAAIEESFKEMLGQ